MNNWKKGWRGRKKKVSIGTARGVSPSSNFSSKFFSQKKYQ
jgi:hypothetical protein